MQIKLFSYLSRNKNPLWQAHIHREGRSPHWLYINWKVDCTNFGDRRLRLLIGFRYLMKNNKKPKHNYFNADERSSIAGQRSDLHSCQYLTRPICFELKNYHSVSSTACIEVPIISLFFFFWTSKVIKSIVLLSRAGQRTCFKMMSVNIHTRTRKQTNIIPSRCGYSREGCSNKLLHFTSDNSINVCILHKNHAPPRHIQNTREV